MPASGVPLIPTPASLAVASLCCCFAKCNFDIAGALQSLGAIVAMCFLETGIAGLFMLGIPLRVTNVFNGGALIHAVTISQISRGREASDIS